MHSATLLLVKPQWVVCRSFLPTEQVQSSGLPGFFRVNCARPYDPQYRVSSKMRLFTLQNCPPIDSQNSIPVFIHYRSYRLHAAAGKTELLLFMRSLRHPPSCSFLQNTGAIPEDYLKYIRRKTAMNNQQQAAPPRRRQGNGTGKIFLTTFLIALGCVLVILLILYLCGIRYTSIRTEIGGYVKFFGKVDADGSPYKGNLFYSNGVTAEVNMADQTVTFSNGDVYRGELNASLKLHGTGTLEYSTGDKYEGQFENGYLSGEGVFTYSNGDKYEGQFAEGKKNGTGTYTWNDGSSYTGGFKDDKKEGEGTYIWADGSSFTGTFVNDLKEGTGTQKFANGDIYTGDYKADARSGTGTYTWANGDIYEGEFAENNMNGQGVYRFASGRVYEGIFENGVIVRDSGDDETSGDE